MLTNWNASAPAAPLSVHRAMLLMRMGAALSVLAAVVVSLTAPRVGALHIGTLSPIIESRTQQVERAVFSGALDCAVWLWMAWKNTQARAWARVLSTVFFFLCCIGTAIGLRQGAIEVRTLDVGIWLVALAATILLWRPESRPFYREPLVSVK